MSKPIAYLNGDWVESSRLAIPIDDLGFLLGTTIVERFRTFRGALFRPERHLKRLRHSLHIAGWDSDKLTSIVENLLDEFIQRNSGFFQPGDDWTVVSFITPGKMPDASKPTICIHGGPLPFANWAEDYHRGIACEIVRTRLLPQNCLPSEIKCRSRMHYYLADREAYEACPGARAILLDQQGFVGEASTANVVAYFADRGLVTPRLSQVLPGVSQEMLFELADRLNLPHEEADIPPQQLAQADELLLTSTSVCVLPVVQLNRRPVGAGRPGEVYQQLLDAWSQEVGVAIADQARQFARREPQ